MGKRDKSQAHILKLTRHNSKKELDSEIAFQLSLTTQERFKMMFEKSNIIKKILLKNGYRKPFEVIKRT